MDNTTGELPLFQQLSFLRICPSTNTKCTACPTRITVIGLGPKGTMTTLYKQLRGAKGKEGKELFKEVWGVCEEGLN